MRGALGATHSGVTDDEVDTADDPIRLIALIETVCGELFEATTVHESGVKLICVQLPLLSLASYPVIAAPFV